MSTPESGPDPRDGSRAPGEEGAKTVLLSRDELRVHLATMLATGGRQDRPVALILLDLDGFESISTGLGEHVSEAVLRQISDRLRSTVRQSDFVGHVGGDLFAILCDHTGIEASGRIAERVLALTRRSLDAVPTHFRLRTSIGLAAFEPASASRPTAEGIIAQAEAALDESRRGGRDRITAVTL